jgi:hypothetical protein
MAMTKRASEDLLSTLHDAVAQELLGRVRSGEASPAELSAAIKFLKDNGIEALPTIDNNIGKLMASLPDFEEDTDDHPIN